MHIELYHKVSGRKLIEYNCDVVPNLHDFIELSIDAKLVKLQVVQRLIKVAVVENIHCTSMVTSVCLTVSPVD
jgi:hypothetical protein